MLCAPNVLVECVVADLIVEPVLIQYIEGAMAPPEVIVDALGCV